MLVAETLEAILKIKRTDSASNKQFPRSCMPIISAIMYQSIILNYSLMCLSLLQIHAWTTPDAMVTLRKTTFYIVPTLFIIFATSAFIFLIKQRKNGTIRHMNKRLLFHLALIIILIVNDILLLVTDSAAGSIDGGSFRGSYINEGLYFIVSCLQFVILLMVKTEKTTVQLARESMQPPLLIKRAFSSASYSESAEPTFSELWEGFEDEDPFYQSTQNVCVGGHMGAQSMYKH